MPKKTKNPKDPFLDDGTLSGGFTVENDGFKDDTIFDSSNKLSPLPPSDFQDLKMENNEYVAPPPPNRQPTNKKAKNRDFSRDIALIILLLLVDVGWFTFKYFGIYQVQANIMRTAFEFFENYEDMGIQNRTDIEINEDIYKDFFKNSLPDEYKRDSNEIKERENLQEEIRTKSISNGNIIHFENFSQVETELGVNFRYSKDWQSNSVAYDDGYKAEYMLKKKVVDDPGDLAHINIYLYIGNEIGENEYLKKLEERKMYINALSYYAKTGNKNLTTREMEKNNNYDAIKLEYIDVDINRNLNGKTENTLVFGKLEDNEYIILEKMCSKEYKQNCSSEFENILRSLNFNDEE